MKKSILSLSLSKGQPKLKPHFNFRSLFRNPLAVRRTCSASSSTIYHLPLRLLSGSSTSTTYSKAFTIVELLVVIVVIGILAAITIVAYTGISNKATVASLQSDLTNAKKQLALYNVDHGYYPASINTGAGNNNCPTPTDDKYCLKPSGSNLFVYTPNPAGNTSPQAYRLTATNTSSSYATTNSTQPAIVKTVASCPTGFIPIPGSGTYGTSDFCAMKYEAKQVGATTTPISTAAGTPWVSISQTTAIANSPNVAGCTGCHLITENEWMTIAQNVLSVPGNWSGGTVGSGNIPRGNSNSAAATDASADLTGVNKRTLTLSNGEIIWDLAGNVWDWTAGTDQSPTVQPGITGTGANWREWNTVTNPGTISPNPSATATGITGASSWNSGYGIGMIYSDTEQAGLRGFLRGGNWGSGGYAGVLALNLYGAPSAAGTDVGFRVAAP